MATKDLLREEIKKNWIWIVVTIFGLGGAFVTLGYQGENIKTNRSLLDINSEKIMECKLAEIRLTGTDEKALMKLEVIENGIKDLKETVEKMDVKMNERMTKMNDKTQVQFDEIKKILYKPAISSVWNNDLDLVKK